MKKYVLSVQTGSGCERARIVIGLHDVDGFKKIVGERVQGEAVIAEWLDHMIRYGIDYAEESDYTSED